ncbi:MAG TPA: hypothetical protein VGK73_24925 [Polyangiaceae bacterium]
MRPATLFLCLCASTFAVMSDARAHIGSPDIVYEGSAGPYPLSVAVAPPETVPGLARATLRTTSDTLDAIEIVGVPIEPQDHAPRADLAVRDPGDPKTFTASLWIMTPGTWKVRVRARGRDGVAELAIPVPALPGAPGVMSTELALLLGILAALIVAGAVGILGAAQREAQLVPGAPIPADNRRRARRSMLVASAVIGSVLLAGATWWDDTAGRHRALSYRPTALTAWLDDAGRLFLALEDPGWLARRPDDLVPDHGHLMHLYAVRVPGLDRVLHLHPDLQSPGRFGRDLPALPSGRYRLFADIVHASGLAETLVSEIELPDVPGRPLAGDDSARAVPGISTPAASGPVPLDDGSRMTLEPAGTLRARRPLSLKFRVTDANGAAVGDLVPYMGMLGHLAVIAHDLGTFTHVHPSGTVPMAAFSVAQASDATSECAPTPPDDPARARPPASEVAFPYLFPRAGRYRLFAQVKRAGRVLTGAFDVQVSAP